MNNPLPRIHESPKHLKQLFKHESHPGRRQRLHALYLLASGQAARRTDVAVLLGVDCNTVGRWLTSYAQGGLPALLDVYVPAGKRPALSSTQLAQLQQALRRPADFASYDEVRCWIEQNLGISLTYKTVHRLVRYKLKAKLKVARPSHEKKR